MYGPPSERLALLGGSRHPRKRDLVKFNQLLEAFLISLLPKPCSFLLNICVLNIVLVMFKRTGSQAGKMFT